MTYEDKLIQRIEQGDASAIEELIKIFYPEILRYCIWHAPDRFLAEDAAQETFLKVIRYFDRYTHKGKFKSFLYQVAANTCTDIYRTHRQMDVSLEASSIDIAYVESDFENIQADMIMKQLIKNLPDDTKEIFLLRFAQDLTLREIAQVLHIPLRTVQSRLRTALKRLKKDLEKKTVMKNDVLQKNLRQILQQSPALTNESHLENTLCLVRQEACRKQKRKRISFTQFLTKQIKFMGWKIWITQGIFLCLLISVLSQFFGYPISPQTMAKLLFCLSVLVFITMIPYLYRCVRYQMQEIEAAARFSSTKLLMAKLIIIGIGDVSILCGIFFTTILQTALPAAYTVLYLCLPFLLAGGGLFLLNHCTPRHFLTGSLLFCRLLILGACMIPGHYMLELQQSFPIIWIMVCVLLSVFCIRQLRHITQGASYTEMQLI